MPAFLREIDRQRIKEWLASPPAIVENHVAGIAERSWLAAAMDTIEALEKRPSLAVDGIIFKAPVPGRNTLVREILLIERKNPPYGWALPGGFMNSGEAAEEAVAREVKEETGLDMNVQCQFSTYSHPDRDPRHHVVSIVYVGTAAGEPKASDDAAKAKWFKLADDEVVGLPALAFDHYTIIQDYLRESPYRRRS